MIIGRTAHEVVKKAIDYVLKNGQTRDVFGGTIPLDIKDRSSPNDFNRGMIECEPGLTLKLLNPLARWSDISLHYTGITLRETEDSLQGFNPGFVTYYSNLYKRWLVDGYFNYTYGERLQHYIYNPSQISGKKSGMNSSFNQLEKTIELLKKHPSTRRACISTWHPLLDVGGDYVPCNMIFMLRIVDGELDWTTVIRSLDVLRGLTENIFMFSAFQELVASRLKVPLGNYYTACLNAHLYKDMIDKGYHKQKIVDPYNHYKPRELFREPFPSKEFEKIDKLIFSCDYDSCLNTIARIESNSWRNWKYALASEYFRLQGKYNEAFGLYSEIENEYKFPVARRLMRNVPECINMLPFTKQYQYLRRVLNGTRT